MAEKKLKISLDLDDKQFTSSVKRMQDELNKINAAPALLQKQREISQKMTQLGLGPLPGVPSDRDAVRAQERSRTDQAKLLREKKDYFELLKKEQDKLNDQLKNINLKEHERLNIQKELNGLKDEEVRTTGELATITSKISRNYGQLPKNQKDDFFSTGIDIKTVSKSVGAIMAIAAAGSAIYDQYSNIPIARTQALGRGTQALVGSPLEETMYGGPAQNASFMFERAEAQRMASERAESRVKTAMMPGGGLKEALTGGGTAAMMGGLTNFTSKALDALLPDVLPGLTKNLKTASEKYMSQFSAEIFAQMGEDAAKTYAAKIQEDPRKMLASKFLDTRYMQDLQTQRMLGLGFQGFHGQGGFQQSMNLGGFNMDMGAQMAAQIQSAGGSTRGMRGGALTALQAQRGFDLTNAGTVMGRISGAVGSEKASQDIFRKIIEESMRAGLDKSEFREEQRRFADTTSEILARSGATTQQDAESVIKNFSRFLGDQPTIKGMEGAKSAYQEQQAFSAETSGRGGALQFASLSRRGLGKLGFKGMAGLMEMPESDIIPSNDYVISEAAKLGMKPEELVRKVREAKMEKSYVEIGLNPNKGKKVRDYLAKQGLTGKKLTSEQLGQMPKDVMKAYNDIQEAATIRSNYETPQKREAVVRGLIAGEAQPEEEYKGMGPTLSEAVKRGLEKRDTERPEDKVVEATGAQAQAMLENFTKLKDSVTPAADAIDRLTKNLLLLNTALEMIPEKDRGYAASTIGQQLFNAETSAAQRQQQGGKPKQGQGRGP